MALTNLKSFFDVISIVAFALFLQSITGVDLTSFCGFSRLKKMMLVGLKRLLGVWLPGLELKLPQLVYLDLSQCDLISDDELRQLVTRKPDVIAYNYYHEEMSTQADNNPEPPSSSAGEAPCPASLGAFVDF